MDSESTSDTLIATSNSEVNDYDSTSTSSNNSSVSSLQRQPQCFQPSIRHSFKHISLMKGNCQFNCNLKNIFMMVLITSRLFIKKQTNYI